MEKENQEKQEAINTLKKWIDLDNKNRIYTLNRHTSQSGLMRHIAALTPNLGGDMKDLTLEQRNALKITEYILGKRGGLLDEEINEAVIIGYNVEGGTK